MGYEDHNIVVDVVMSANPELPHVNADNYNAFNMVTRSSELMEFYRTKYGVIRA